MTATPVRWSANTPGMPPRFERLRFLDTPPAPGTPGAPPAPPAPPAVVTMSQAELDALIGQRAAEAARAAKKAAEDALTAKLGDRKLDDLLSAADAAKAADDAKKTEAERALEAANAAKAEAEKDRATAKAELHTTRVHAALQAAGVPEAGVAAIIVPDLTVDSTPEEIKAAVTKLKTALPGLFTATPAVPSDPGKPPAPKDNAGEFGAAGKSEFERRYPPKPAA